MLVYTHTNINLLSLVNKIAFIFYPPDQKLVGAPEKSEAPY